MIDPEENPQINTRIRPAVTTSTAMVPTATTCCLNFAILRAIITTCSAARGKGRRLRRFPSVFGDPGAAIYRSGSLGGFLRIDSPRSSMRCAR